MKVHEIMTAHARCVGPDNMLVEAAGLMRELDVGALPVWENDQLTGMVTDRDIVLRGTANGRDPNSTPVRDVMTASVMFVRADQEVEEAVRMMEDNQIRRLPVMGAENRLVGIVSLGDVAISSNPAFSGKVLRDVSEPTEPTARQRKLSEQSEPNRMRMEPVSDTTSAPRRGRRLRGPTGAGKRTPKSTSARSRPTFKRKRATETPKQKSSPRRKQGTAKRARGR